MITAGSSIFLQENSTATAADKMMKLLKAEGNAFPKEGNTA